MFFRIEKDRMIDWSQQLFLRLNTFVGKNPMLDAVMYVCAKYLIVFMYFGLLATMAVHLFADWDAPYLAADIGINLLFELTPLLVTIGIALLISWAIAILFPHHRPVTEHPKITLLIHPLSNWKSFPSDHTIVAFVPAFFLSGTLLYIWLTCAAFVAVGRVYVGVHYPRDIIGGVIVSWFAVLASRSIVAFL